MTHLSDELYRKNIAALRAFRNSLANTLDAVVIPKNVVPATGRDGSATFLMLNGQGEPAWFGGSSMPRVSAEELFGNVRGDGGSVALPGILTGAEADFIAARLARHSAVFVVEESPLNLKLAMHLHDYSTLIGDGRLVCFLADELEPAVGSFFAEHPGFEMPTNLFRVPQRTGGEIAELQRRMERAGAEVFRVQSERIASDTASIRARAVGRLPDAPRTAVVSAIAGASATISAGRIGRALRRLGWPAESCVPDGPGKCHVAARVGAIERGRAELVIHIGGVSAAERSLIPEELPAVSLWFGEHASLPIRALRAGPFDLWLSESASVQDAWIASGIPHDQTMRLEPAADVDRADAELNEVSPDPYENPRRNEQHANHVLIFMDVPDDRAPACGITLPSQVALWQALQSRVLHDADRYSHGTAEEFLERAEKDSETIVTDVGSREGFLAMVRARLAPATIGRAVVQGLVKKGIRVQVWGSNWPAMGRGEEVRRGLIPETGAEIRRLIPPNGFVVVPWLSDAGVRIALESLAGGSVVAMRGSQGAFLQEYPGLASIAGFIRFFHNDEALVQVVHAVQNDRATFFDEIGEARNEVLARHTVAARLVWIVQKIQQRQDGGAGSPHHPKAQGRDPSKTAEEFACGRS